MCVIAVLVQIDKKLYLSNRLGIDNIAYYKMILKQVFKISICGFSEVCLLKFYIIGTKLS